MIRLAGSRGYAATTTEALRVDATISKRDMYRHFPSKDALFLATYDYVVDRGLRHIGSAYAAEGDWRARLRAGFTQFATLVADDPNAARLALVEVLGMGPVVVGRMERTRSVFERALTASFDDAPDAVRLPPLLAKGIVCGIERVTRQRLLTGTTAQLPELVDELLDWALAYRCAAVADLPAPPTPAFPLAPRARATSDPNERARILQATAEIAARDGYLSLVPANIAKHAGVSPQTVRALYPDLQVCFFDALERLSVEVLVTAAVAARGAPDSFAAVHRGIAAVMGHVARDPVLRRVAFVQVFALGPAGVERREALLHRFTTLLVDTVPADLGASELVIEAIVGAIWGLIHHHVVNDGAHRLPGLSQDAAYLALAPLIGAARAVEVILGERTNDQLLEQP